jgi:hypothetical protein
MISRLLDSPVALGNDKSKKTERRFAIVGITTIVVMPMHPASRSYTICQILLQIA